MKLFYFGNLCREFKKIRLIILENLASKICVKNVIYSGITSCKIFIVSAFAFSLAFTQNQPSINSNTKPSTQNIAQNTNKTTSQNQTSQDSQQKPLEVIESTSPNVTQQDFAQPKEAQLLPSQNLSQSESFITPQEYGASLYEYPRGIGCIKCHGSIGEEMALALYIHKGKQKQLIVPRINNLELSHFKSALSQDRGVMPKYNLTDEEINAIYVYVNSKNPTRIK